MSMSMSMSMSINTNTSIYMNIMISCLFLLEER